MTEERKRPNHIASVSERAERLREEWGLPGPPEKIVLRGDESDLPIISDWDSVFSRGPKIYRRAQEIERKLRGGKEFTKASPAVVEAAKSLLQDVETALKNLSEMSKELEAIRQKQDVGAETEEGESPCGPGQVLVDDECVDVPPGSIAENASSQSASPAKSKISKTFAKGAPCPYPRCKARGTRHTHESKAWGVL